MNKIIFAAMFLFTTTSFAQYGSKVFGGNLGLNSGALNVGLSIDSGTQTGDLGGSFFLQTEKEDAGINQIMTFGAHINMNVYDNNSWLLNLRPGVNITMISDVATGAGQKDDKTVLGPSLRWSMAHRLSSGFEVGIERLEAWNWFDDEAPTDVSFTTLVFRNRF